MNERLRNLTVGSTVIAGLVGLVFLLLVFGYLPRFLKTGYFIEIALDDAAGVNPGSRVQLVGINVGQIESIAFNEPFDGGVRARARIKDDIRIPVGARVEVEEEILGGSPTLSIVVDRQGLVIDKFVPIDGSATLEGGPGAFASAMGGFRQIADDFGTLSEEWRGVGAKINGFLAPEGGGDSGSPLETVSSVIARVDTRLAELETVLAGIDAIVNDPELRENISATGRNVRAVSEQAGEGLAALQQRYVALADDMSKVLADAQSVMEKADRGEGTMGRTLNDPALYDNFNDASLRMSTALDDLSLLIAKWKAEGVPIKF